jgi:hypothetical protein
MAVPCYVLLTTISQELLPGDQGKQNINCFCEHLPAWLRTVLGFVTTSYQHFKYNESLPVIIVVSIEVFLHQKKGEDLAPITYNSCLLSLPRRDILFTRSVSLWYTVERNIVLTLNTRNFASILITRPWHGCYDTLKN